jgi:hypothetical protein
MTRKSDETPTSKSDPLAEARPRSAILRLVHGGEQSTSTESAEAPLQMPKKSLGSQWDSNDDDPGPTAA